MIAVDTSVWVTALADAKSAEARHLDELLDADLVLLPAPVRVELLAGASRRDHARLRDTLAALHRAVPIVETWDQIEEWTATAVTAGERFGVMDLLIAALADERGAKVWSHDTDFARMERLGFVTRYTPP